MGWNLVVKLHHLQEAPISPAISKNDRDWMKNKKMAAKSMWPALKSVAPFVRFNRVGVGAISYFGKPPKLDQNELRIE